MWGFENDENLLFLDETINGETELEIMTFILSGKGHFPVKWYNIITPFVIVGGGFMHADADYKFSGAGLSIDSSADETDFCAKIGGGFDFFFNESFSVNLEGNYTSGFGDLDGIEYFHFILGGAFRFDLPYGNHEF